MTYKSTLTALAHPTRRRAFEQLKLKARSAGDIALRMPVSRLAVSRRLKMRKGTRRKRGAWTSIQTDGAPCGSGSTGQALMTFQAEIERDVSKREGKKA
jgi:DNA-binding transcriptional ArsR family regulator